MSEGIQWDSSLVKKFGSSNHFKLLTQLKTEVKAFPLKRRKKQTSSVTHERMNNSHQSSTSNLEVSRSFSSFENRTNENKHQQSQSVFKSKHNSYKNINLPSNDLAKENIPNESIIKHEINQKIEEKKMTIYNNNEITNDECSPNHLGNLSCSVSFKETEQID